MHAAQAFSQAVPHAPPLPVVLGGKSGDPCLAQEELMSPGETRYPAKVHWPVNLRAGVPAPVAGPHRPRAQSPGSTAFLQSSETLSRNPNEWVPEF